MPEQRNELQGYSDENRQRPDDYINELLDWLVDVGILTAEEADMFRPGGGGGEVDVAGTYSVTITWISTEVEPETEVTIGFDDVLGGTIKGTPLDEEKTSFSLLISFSTGEEIPINSGQASELADGSIRIEGSGGGSTTSLNFTLGGGVSGSFVLGFSDGTYTVKHTFSIAGTKQ